MIGKWLGEWLPSILLSTLGAGTCLSAPYGGKCDGSAGDQDYAGAGPGQGVAKPVAVTGPQVAAPALLALHVSHLKKELCDRHAG